MPVAEHHFCGTTSRKARAAQRQVSLSNHIGEEGRPSSKVCHARIRRYGTKNATLTRGWLARAAMHYHLVAGSALAVPDLHSRKHERRGRPVTYDFSGGVAFYGRRNGGKAVRQWQLGLPWPAPVPADRTVCTVPATSSASVAVAADAVADADAAFAPFWCWHPACSVILRMETL